MDAKGLKVLIADDEPDILEIIQYNLKKEGYTVVTAKDGDEALTKAKQEAPDLIILDIMLPEMDGIAVAENIRIQNLEIPILMLSARNSSADRVLGLKKGADDYLTKPFNLEELLLRVSKLIEKNQKLQDRTLLNDQYQFGTNQIDFKAQQATGVDGKIIELSKKETMLLKLLIENKNEVVPREKILQTVWGYNVYPTTRTIDNFILNFRKHFEEDPKTPRYFLSVRGVGYRFCD